MAINLTSGGLNGLTNVFSTSSTQPSAPSVSGWVSMYYTSRQPTVKLPSAGTYLLGLCYPTDYSGSVRTYYYTGRSVAGGTTVISFDRQDENWTSQYTAIRLS